MDAGIRDTDKLPPWLKHAQGSAVVARLRRDLEVRGDKPYLGNNAGRVPLLVQGTSEGPEAGSMARPCAHRTTATQGIVHSVPEIDTEDINDPTMGKNEIATRVEQAEKETDRLRTELSGVKEQLENSERAAAKLVHELLRSKRELNAARDELEGRATAAANAAKRAEADVATLHSELEVVRSELTGKTSELNEMRPQLDLAMMQLRIFQETYAESSSQAKTAEMHAEQAGFEFAVVNAQFGAMSTILPELNKGSIVWLDGDSPASCVWHPQSLPVNSQFCTQEQLAALRQQQCMLQLQQEQQTQYYQVPQQQQPQHQMGISQYYQALQQPQKSVQVTLPAGAHPCRTYESEAEGRMSSFPQGYGPR